MLRGVLAQTDLLIPNEAEALRLAGRGSLPEAVTALTAAGPALVVKQGARGALCVQCGARHACHVRLPPVRPVDTTGAGDCFNAGLITGLLRGLPLPQAAALGCAVAAASTQAPGGTGGSMDLSTALRRAQQAAIHQAPSALG